jgi:hypothetical protein
MLDANAVMESDKKLEDLMQSCRLEDMHLQTPAPSTYLGSQDRRIDYVFGCTRTKSALTRQGSLSFFEGPVSNHRGLYVDISLRDILGEDVETTTIIQPANQRSLRSGNPEVVQSYNASMREYYKQHKMVERLDEIVLNHHRFSLQKVRRLLTGWDTYMV